MLHAHTYTEKLFVAYLKFKFNWYPIFLFPKSGNAKSLLKGRQVVIKFFFLP